MSGPKRKVKVDLSSLVTFAASLTIFLQAMRICRLFCDAGLYATVEPCHCTLWERAVDVRHVLVRGMPSDMLLKRLAAGPTRAHSGMAILHDAL